MSVARFFILAGPGHRYHGDGLQPQVLLTIYDDKAVWLLNDLRSGENRYCHSSGESLFDDAMLLLAVFAYWWLGKQTPELPRAFQQTMEDYGILDWEILTAREYSGFSHFDNQIIRWPVDEAKH